MNLLEKEKYCICYGNNDFTEFMDIIKKYPLVELRLDKCNFTIEQIKEALSTHSKIIITYRSKFLSNEIMDMLIQSINYGAAYIDLYIEWDSKAINTLIKHARTNNTNIILSYHNFIETPAINELVNILRNCEGLAPDIIKIACKANSFKDTATIISLYTKINYTSPLENKDLKQEIISPLENKDLKQEIISPLENEDLKQEIISPLENKDLKQEIISPLERGLKGCVINNNKTNKNKYQLIAFSMGELGKISRLASLFLGAPFIYTSYEKGKETADGQMDIVSLKKIIELLEYGS